MERMLCAEASKKEDNYSLLCFFLIASSTACDRGDGHGPSVLEDPSFYGFADFSPRMLRVLTGS